MTTKTATAPNETAKKKEAATTPRGDEQAVLTASQVHTIAQSVYRHLAARAGWTAWPVTAVPEAGALAGTSLAGTTAGTWPWAARAGGWQAAPPVGLAPFACWGL